MGGLLIRKETKVEKEAEKPEELKRDVLRYGLGIRFFRRGTIKFPRYAERRIASYLEGEGLTKGTVVKYLTFAYKYFDTAEAVARGKERRSQLLSVIERWEKEGLKPKYLRRIKVVAAKACRREMKRLSAAKPFPPKKREEMIKHYTQPQELQIRVEKKVLEYLFSKSITRPMRSLYINCAR